MQNTAHFMGGIYPGLPKQLFGSDSGSWGLGVVCGCWFAVPWRSCEPDLGVRLQSQAYRKIRCLVRGGF